MSNRDKKLLVYLIAVGLLAIVYFFIAKPKMDENEQLQTEIETLKNQVNYYNNIYINRADYEDKIAKAQVEYNETVNKFFGGLNQENTLINIKSIEDATDTWITRVSFQDAQIVIGNEEQTSLEDGNPEEESELNDEATSSDSRTITGLKQDLNIDFSCKYSDFKRFIEFLQNYDQRLFVSSIGATYSVDSDQVSGTIVLSQYAITGAGVEYTAPDLSNVNIGVENIFSTLNESSEEIMDISLISSEVIEPIPDTNEESEEANDSNEISNDEESDGAEEIVGDDSESSQDNTLEEDGNSRRRPKTN